MSFWSIMTHELYPRNSLWITLGSRNDNLYKVHTKRLDQHFEYLVSSYPDLCRRFVDLDVRAGESDVMGLRGGGLAPKYGRIGHQMICHWHIGNHDTVCQPAIDGGPVDCIVNDKRVQIKVSFTPIDRRWYQVNLKRTESSSTKLYEKSDFDELHVGLGIRDSGLLLMNQIYIIPMEELIF